MAKDSKARKLITMIQNQVSKLELGGSNNDGNHNPDIQEEKNFEVIEKITLGYNLVMSQPSDWATAYATYFTRSGDPINGYQFTTVSGTSAPEWKADTYFQSSTNVLSYSRDKEPDGTPYDFKALKVFISMPKAVASGIVDSFINDDIPVFYNSIPSANRLSYGYCLASIVGNEVTAVSSIALDKVTNFGSINTTPSLAMETVTSITKYSASIRQTYFPIGTTVVIKAIRR